MQEATSPENFLITKATRLFTVGWLCAYDDRLRKRNLSKFGALWLRIEIPVGIFQ